MRQHLIKSTNYLRAAMGLAVILTLCSVAAGAAAQNNLGFQAQITDSETLTGDISVRLLNEYTDVDVYIAVIDAQNRLFTLVCPSTGGYAFEQGVHRLLNFGHLSPGGWGFLTGVDFSFISMGDGDTVLLAVICPAGADPYQTDLWLGWASCVLLTNPGERQEGQSQFYTIGASNQYQYYGAGEGTSPEVPAADVTDGESEEPEKADIYKLEGDTLYYANTSAAKMQMVDLSVPSAPALAAEVALSHTPNEIFVVEPYVYLIQTRTSASDTGLILTVMDAGASLAAVGQLSLDGLSYITSRRLGNTIFLVAGPAAIYDYLADTTADGPVVVAVDISTPSSPTETARYAATGYASEVYLDQSRLVLLARQGWQSTRLVIFDLTAGSTPLSVSGTLDVAGYVPSEFHVKAKDDHLYVIFRQQDINSGSALGVYDISDLSAISKKGEVTGIAPGEELYAARFSGDRAYLVTYERQDPLWVVDISDPAAPKVLGELEVPGWSEHMVFFDDKLLAVGYDDSGKGQLVSTALFSVADPAAPALLDRVTPFSATDIYYTHSEAISDDRAFYTDLDAGLILFPLSYYDDASHSGLEVVRLTTDQTAFAADHYVDCNFYVLRGAADAAATMAVSMGDAALSTLNVTAGATPSVSGTLRLAYNVSQAGAVDAGGMLWTVGGDFYGQGGADFYLFNPADLTRPAQTLATGMDSPTLVMTPTIGVIYSGYPAAFSAFDPAGRLVGPSVSVGGESDYGFTAPLVAGHTFYLAKSTYEPVPMVTEVRMGEKDGSTTTYGEAWELYRFGISDIQAPAKQTAVSIPGSPLGFTSAGQLVCVEYRQAYGTTDTNEQPVTFTGAIVPDPNTYTYQFRLNLLTLMADRAVLEKTRLISGTAYYSYVMDKDRIYLMASGESTANVVVLDTADLQTVGEFELGQSGLAVKADNGRLVVGKSGWYYYGYGEILADSFVYPGYYGAGFSVYDLTGSAPVLLLSNDTVWPSAGQMTFTGSGIYAAQGYEGVKYFPFTGGQ